MMNRLSPSIAPFTTTTTLKPIRLGIVDDHLIVLEGLILLFQQYPGFNVVFTATHGRDLLPTMQENAVDILILDLDLPNLSGYEVFERIKKEQPDLKIVILTGTFEQDLIVDYYKRGVNACLQKGQSIHELTEALERVHHHGRYMDQRVTELFINAAWDKRSNEPVNFTERELQIIKLIWEDKSSKEIANALLLNLRTVEHDRSAILSKIRARSVSAIVKYALKHRIVSF